MKEKTEKDKCDFGDYPYSEKAFKQTDGKSLKLYVFEPAVEPISCIVCIHGGGWHADYPMRFFRHCGYFARRGALAVSVDYRSIGEHTDVRDLLSDCLDAVRFIQENYGNYRTAVLGESAGGYMAACIGNQTIIGRLDPLFRLPALIVDYNGIVDLKGKWSYGLIRKAGDKESAEELRKLWSPVDQVSCRDSEVLCFHGDADTIVELSDSAAFVRNLTQKGVKARLEVVPGAEHSFILFDYLYPNSRVFERLEELGAALCGKGFLKSTAQ